MSRNPNDRDAFDGVTMKDTYGLMRRLCDVHSLTVGIWVRHKYGSECLGWHGLQGLVLLAAYGTAQKSGACYAYAGLWMIVWVAQGITTRIAQFRGERIHSYAWGESHVAYACGFRTDKAAKGLFEPLLALASGILVGAWVDEALGLYLVAGFVSILGQYTMVQAAAAARARHRRDAEIEMEWQQAYERGNYE